jgi:DNA repair exonuclease SbcCD nuclease subunit
MVDLQQGGIGGDMRLTGAHIADVHFGSDEDLLKEVVACSGFAAEYVERVRPDFVMITGDLYDHRLLLDSAGSLTALAFVRRLAAVCPVLIIRGTDLHDFDSLESLRGLPNVMVVSEARQVFFRKDAGFYDRKGNERPEAVFSCLPSPSKAFLVSLGATPDEAQDEVVNRVRSVLLEWGEANAAMREAGVITVLAGHGTISGAVTSTGRVMIGRDLEYGTRDLELAGADYVGFGHIHKAQKVGPAWYAGSLGRLDAGEQEEKGFLMVELEPGGRVEPGFIRTPARKYLIIDLGKDPENWKEEVRAIFQSGPLDENTVVKVKTSLSETRASEITRKELEAVVGKAVLFEKSVIPIQRTRAEGISTLTSAREKYLAWAETTGQSSDDLILAVVDMLDRPAEEVLVSVRRKLCPEELGADSPSEAARTPAMGAEADLSGSPAGAAKKGNKKKILPEQQASLTLP